VEANGKIYSEVLAMVTRRDNGKLQNLSTRVYKVRRTANGNLLLELNRSKDTSTEAIKESLDAVLGEANAVRALSESARTKTVVISDLDPLVVAEDVTKVLMDKFAVNAESVGLLYVHHTETLRRQWLDCPAKTQKRFSVRQGYKYVIFLYYIF